MALVRRGPVLILVPLVAVVGLAALAITRDRGADAGVGPELRLDFDLSGGACAAIEDSHTVDAGTQFQVAVCLSNPGVVPVAAFQYRVTYDDGIIRAPEVLDLGSGLDDNPDANAGGTTFSTPDLGFGWDCGGGVGAYPRGDLDPSPGNGIGIAYSGGCGSPVGPNSLTNGPLGVITFDALAGGGTALGFVAASVIDDALAEVGTCDPIVEVAMTCVGGSVQVLGPTATATRTPTNTPEPTSSVPTITPTPASPSAQTLMLLEGEKQCIPYLIVAGFDVLSAVVACVSLETPDNLLTVAAVVSQSDGEDDAIIDPSLIDDPATPEDDRRIDFPCSGDTNGDGDVCARGDLGVDDPVEVRSQVDLRDDGLLDGKYTLRPADFAPLDLDANQLHELDGTFTVVYFSDVDSPISFTTEKGALRHPARPGLQFSSMSCGFENDVQAETFFDADCDSDGVRGDGVATLELTAFRFHQPPPARGRAEFEAIQGGQDIEEDFTVVGEMASISIEVLHQPAVIGATPEDCDLDSIPVSPLGALNPHVAVVKVQALDSDGTSIASTLLDWSVDDPAKAFLAFPQTPTWDLAALGHSGAGFIQPVCGGSAPGFVTVTAKTSEIQSIDPRKGQAEASVQVEIVGGAPSPTATSTSTPTETPTATGTPTATATGAGVPGSSSGGGLRQAPRGSPTVAATPTRVSTALPAAVTPTPGRTVATGVIVAPDTGGPSSEGRGTGAAQWLAWGVVLAGTVAGATGLLLRGKPRNT